MKLVEDWKECYKWFSTHAMVFAGALQGAWMYIPDDLKGHIPSWTVNVLTISLLVLGVFGRVVEQTKKVS